MKTPYVLRPLLITQAYMLQQNHVKIRELSNLDFWTAYLEVFLLLQNFHLADQEAHQDHQAQVVVDSQVEDLNLNLPALTLVFKLQAFLGDYLEM